MKFIIGSGSERKLKISQKIISQLINENEIEIISYSANSQVPETPWDNQTPTGAKNRAIDSKNNVPDGDYWIGLESGLIKRVDRIFEEAWCCIINKENNEFYGYSSGLKVPDFITKKMENLKMEHSDVMILLERENHLPNADTWANYTGNIITRDSSLEESLRNALVQIFSSDNSLYRK